MGTDIHGVFQRYEPATDQWQDIASTYRQDRHYQLFAVLADVRNGYGFAGVITGEPVVPIASPRGLPTDFVCDEFSEHPVASPEFIDPSRREYYKDKVPHKVWMGNHSHSWLTGEEMLAWSERAPRVIKTGVLHRSVYEIWDGVNTPSEYSGGVFGPRIILINDNAIERAQNPNWTHIRCGWESGLHEELAYFFDEVARLVAEHGKIRFVFGFDS